MVTILYQDIAKDALFAESSRIAWKSKEISTMKDDIERKRMANSLAMEAAKCALDFTRIGETDFAIETGITAIYLFLKGGHYLQVLSSIEGFRDKLVNTRFRGDIEYYSSEAEKCMKSPDISKRSGRLDALYRLVWEKSGIGTTDAIKKMGKLCGKTFERGTINRYTAILAREKRVYRLGGPTGFPLEIFLNQSRTLSRKMNYGKVAFFEGSLIEQGPRYFKRDWGCGVSHRKIYEIENGNDPKAYAILEAETMLNTSIRSRGVMGHLHPISEMPNYGFIPQMDITIADFLFNCSIRTDGRGR